MKNTLFSNQKKYDKYIKIALITGWAICFIILAEALNIYLFFIGKSNQMKIFISITFFIFAILIIILLFLYNFNSKKIRLEKKNLLAINVTLKCRKLSTGNVGFPTFLLL